MQTTSQQLIAILAITRHAVKILTGKGFRKVAAHEAILMARSGEYEWGGSAHRVRWMRARNTPQWQACWRTTDAAVLPLTNWPPR